MPDSQLFAIVRNGIPSAGMPAFRSSLDTVQIKAVVNYLRVLQGKQSPAAYPGNPAKGRQLFSGSAHCAGCHMVNGHGGFIGSDLSVYARDRSAQEIQEAIIHPEKDSDPRSKKAAVITRNGQKFTGIIRNEDNFSLQLQSLDGSFHLFMKSDLKNVEVGPDPLMPAAYGTELSAAQISDLVSYLMRAAQPSGPEVSAHPDWRHDDR